MERKKRGMSPEQVAEMWRRWKAGQTLRGIGNVIGAMAEKQVRELLAASEHERPSMIRKEEGFRTLALFPPPLTWVFDRGLHFVAGLRRGAIWSAEGPAGSIDQR